MQNGLKITQEDLQKIYGNDWEEFQQKILTNCLCRCTPRNVTTIVDYEIFLNDLNDVLLRGKCKNCGGPVARYIETGELPEYEEAIEEVRRRYEKEKN